MEDAASGAGSELIDVEGGASGGQQPQQTRIFVEGATEAGQRQGKVHVFHVHPFVHTAGDLARLLGEALCVPAGRRLEITVAATGVLSDTDAVLASYGVAGGDVLYLRKHEPAEYEASSSPEIDHLATSTSGGPTRQHNEDPAVMDELLQLTSKPPHPVQRKFGDGEDAFDHNSVAGGGGLAPAGANSRKMSFASATGEGGPPTKIYKCSLCGNHGHNKRKCEMNPNKVP